MKFIGFLGKHVHLYYIDQEAWNNISNSQCFLKYKLSILVIHNGLYIGYIFNEISLFHDFRWHTHSIILTSFCLYVCLPGCLSIPIIYMKTTFHCHLYDLMLLLVVTCGDDIWHWCEKKNKEILNPAMIVMFSFGFVNECRINWLCIKYFNNMIMGKPLQTK